MKKILKKIDDINTLIKLKIMKICFQIMLWIKVGRKAKIGNIVLLNEDNTDLLNATWLTISQAKEYGLTDEEV